MQICMLNFGTRNAETTPMSASTSRNPRPRPRPAPPGRAAAGPKRKPAPPPAPAEPLALRVRAGLGLTRKQFARLSGFSERALAAWEAGEAPGDQARLRLTELDRLRAALARVINPAALADWLDTPADAFDGLKPIEVVERGQIDRLWRMVFELESGSPF